MAAYAMPFAMEDVWNHVTELPEREQRMLMLRFEAQDGAISDPAA